MRLVFFTLPGLIVRFNWRFPIGTHRSSASHACNRAADHFIVQPCPHAVGVVIDRAVFTNTKMLCRLDGVNIGAEEQEFPTILALLMLDHLLNTSAIIATTRIFHSIRRDDEQGVRRNIFLSRILVDVADVVDCASNRIQQGGAAAHTILPISHGLDVSDINAVMDHFADIVKEDGGDQRFAGSFLLLSIMALKPPIVSDSSPLMEPLRSRIKTISVRFLFIANTSNKLWLFGVSPYSHILL